MKPEQWHEVERLFHAALERLPEARGAFLDEACGKDSALRRQLEMLIAKDEPVGSFLEKPVLADAAGAFSAAGSLVGRQFGPYRILSSIGAGGMGEVYRARDTRLGRDVALKTLPPELARDPDRIARFHREARLLAALNHPGIAAIHGLEESGAIPFLVLELVEGQTLADQLKHGPIPVEKSLSLALQIAEALEAAHEKGVIHRDLKPANIKVTPDGQVKVLDFGLGKAFAGEHQEAALTHSPTMSELATQQGIILGTAAYMSPEQAKGKPVDTRADIWAFGVVLYEMLTGRQPFAADTVLDTLAGVLRKEPEWEKVPTALRSLLRRCLQKTPDKRPRDIHDVKIELEEALAPPEELLIQPASIAKPLTNPRMMLLWLAAAVLLGAAITGVAVWKLKSTPAVETRQVTRLYYELPKDQQFGSYVERNLSVSPDGRRLVYSTSGPLYLRSMDELDAKPIPGTEGAQKPFFSPDGKWIGFLSPANNQLKKISITGGPPVALATVDSFGALSWGADDAIVYCQRGKGIMRLSANGGVPEQIAKAAVNEILIHPQILPDGRSVLFTRLAPAPYEVVVQSLKSGERKALFEGSDACYLPTGHIVYWTWGDLRAAAFDPEVLEVKGVPITLVEGVYRGVAAPQFAVSESGTLAYIPRLGSGSAVAVGRRTLMWVDRKGKAEPLAAAPNNYSDPRISPDGTRLAMVVHNGYNRDIWIRDLIYGALTRLTFDAPALYSLWTPDGKGIVFFSAPEGRSGVYWKAADGTGKDELLLSGSHLIPSSWSGDGKTLVLAELGLASGTVSTDIGALPMEGDRKYKRLLQGKHNEHQPQISPNGRWIAYTSNESGTNEIYVRPFPEVHSGRWQVSTSGGYSPLWSPDGRELFYRNADAVMAVSVKTDPTFSFETPATLFQITDVTSFALDPHPWDISPDGKRFLMMKETAAPEESAGPRRINIVLNWSEELRQRAPLK
jgi:serine/threonine-protein kinase